MKTIPLTQGKVALVSDKDYTYLNQWKWHYHITGYARRARQRSEAPGSQKIRMHNVIAERMGLDPAHIDHRDRNGLNNCRRNLRPSNKATNGRNRGPQSNNKSGYKGVGWHKAAGKWFAQIRVNGIQLYLGLFTDVIAAAQAYNKAAKKHFGHFAYLNPI